MNLENMAVGLSLFAVAVSLICLTGLIQIRNRLRSFTSSKNRKDIDQILAELLTQSQLTKKQQEQIKETLRDHENQFKKHFQYMGIVRFNPFSDTGGDQSFTMALLDGHHDGFVISSLHARDQTRIFSKPITAGSGSGFELSKEEKQAIDRALDNKNKA